MKKKLVSLFIMAICCLSLSIGVFASSIGDFYYKGVNAYVHGYIDFGKYLTCTKMWSNISLGGSERSSVTANYRVEVNSKSVKKGTLNYKNQSASYTAVKCDKNAPAAYLILNFDNQEKWLRAAAK